MSNNELKRVNIKDCLDYLNKLISDSKPLAALFKTDSYGYLYDTGTNKVFQCNDIEYAILDRLLNEDFENSISDFLELFGHQKVIDSLNSIINAIEQENILMLKKLDKFYSPEHFEKLEEQIDKHLYQVTLELTEQCNLRCKYCIYNDNYSGMRNHGKTEMTLEIAKAAVEYAAKHGDETKGVAITFYGGEPLLKYDLIKYCVDYSNKIIRNKPVTYSMSTNLTLVTPEIAKFLASTEGFSVLCSIDGPKHIHDSCRKTLDGDGSFDKAIRGLRYLVEAYGDSAQDNILINMVYTPPYYPEKLEEIMTFINELEWLPKKIVKTITYPSENSISQEVSAQMNNVGSGIGIYQHEMSLLDWSFSKYLKKIEKNETTDDFLAKEMVHQSILRIHKRPIYQKPNGLFPMNGCCVPGVRKIYICADGKLLLCEKIAGSPILGNIFDGVDINTVRSILVDEYSKKTIVTCSKCWAARLCSMCYAQCYTDGNLDMEKRNNCCIDMKREIESNLVFYHKCMETNSEGLEYLNDITVR